MSKQKKPTIRYVAIGTPDEGNFYWGMHTTKEVWHFEATDLKKAIKKAIDHFSYFEEENIEVALEPASRW